MKIPFLDLTALHDPIKDEIDITIKRVIESSAFSGGSFVAKFEEEFAAFCQCKYAIGVGSGTEALWVALLNLGIKEGDEVITVPNTFIATAEAISFCGAKPVFVDIDAQTYNMDPALLEAVITPKTKAIIPVHLYGQMADMDPIMDIARKYNLVVIEDACQAHGAEYKGRRAGSIGDAGCFSFYPGKNLGAFGEAGAIVTNNEDLAIKCRMFRDHGQPRKYYHDMIGWNARMDGLQGAILSVKLKYLDTWNEARRKSAMLYNELLSGIEHITIPTVAAYRSHVYHIYAICFRNRDDLIKALSEEDINCGIHYPVPIHLQKAYVDLGYKGKEFPIAEKSAREVCSLPMYPGLAEYQQHHIAEMIKRVLWL